MKTKIINLKVKKVDLTLCQNISFIDFSCRSDKVKGRTSHQQSKNPPPGGAGPSSGVDGGGGGSIAENTTIWQEIGLSFR